MPIFVISAVALVMDVKASDRMLGRTDSTGLSPSDKEYIKELALASGFKLKEQGNGRMDLNPYVYEFAQRLLAQAK